MSIEEQIIDRTIELVRQGKWRNHAVSEFRELGVGCLLQLTAIAATDVDGESGEAVMRANVWVAQRRAILKLTGGSNIMSVSHWNDTQAADASDQVVAALELTKAEVAA